MSNDTSFAGRATTYGNFAASGYSQNHQGDNISRSSTTNQTATVIQADTININEYKLFGEISAEAYRQICRVQAATRDQLPRLETSLTHVLQSRGRDHTPRGGGIDSQRGSRHGSAMAAVSPETGDPASVSSRSPSRTRIPMPRYSSRSRRYSSLSRESRLSDRCYSAPNSSILSSATTSFQEIDEVFGLTSSSATQKESIYPSNSDKPPPKHDRRDTSISVQYGKAGTDNQQGIELDNLKSDSVITRQNMGHSNTQGSGQPRHIDKPLPWIGHLLDPGGSRNDVNVCPVTAKPGTTEDKRYGVDMTMSDLARHLRLALQHVERLQAHPLFDNTTTSNPQDGKDDDECQAER